MKVILASAAAFLGLLLAGSAGRADLAFTQPNASVGQIRIGAALVHSFAFRNNGPGTMEITNLHVSCGCLTPILPNRVYQPGQRGVIELQVNTLTQPAGLQAWRLDVNYRADGKEQTRTLWLRAHLIREINVEPAALVITGDASVARSILITDSRLKPLRVTAVRASACGVQVIRLTPDSKPGHEIIGVRIGNDFPEGRHDEIVSIYTDDPGYPELRVPVTIEKHARQRVLARPHEVELIAPSGQPTPSCIVLLRDREDHTVRIEHIHADDPAITARWAAGPGTMATVRIQVDRRRIRGASLKSTLHIYLQRPVTQEVIVPVSCRLLGDDRAHD